MELLIDGLLILLGGGLLSLCLNARARAANLIGAASAVGGCGLALVPVVRTLVAGSGPGIFTRPWAVPYASFTLELDPLSAWFALPILMLVALAAVYGWGYLLHAADRHANAGAAHGRAAEHDSSGPVTSAGRKPLGVAWFFYNLLAASMVVVVTARNGILFLVAWEVMALASYFLVVFEHERDNVRKAGLTYLIASHLGTAFLLAFFVLLGREAGSLDFGPIAHWVATSNGFAPSAANALFLLAVVGFGTKAGFVPLHVWLPEAHPAAPSHVSAVMSGVMIKTGIYGLLRGLTFLGPPPVWWGWTLIAIGVVSGLLGVLNALAQHDLKRLLAYHSVENIGIVALGLGAGLLGLAVGQRDVAVLGLAGGLLHVLNHAVFKALLFFGAGTVIHATGTANMDLQGGLAKRMPVPAATFAVGAVAICGLPPLNGFVSEFLIYLGAFKEVTLAGTSGSIPALAIIGGLALIGGLAVACFTKAFGVVFLGEPRHEAVRETHAVGWAMLVPMIALAAACALIAWCAIPVVRLLGPVLASLTLQPVEASSFRGDGAFAPLMFVAAGSVALTVLALILAAARWVLLAKREVGQSPTWDCGFAKPTAHMQYTASSFAQLPVDYFAPMLRTHQKITAPDGLFPTQASLETHPCDAATELCYRPVFSAIHWTVSKLSWIQQGHVNLYVLYIAAAVVSLLIWYLGIAS